MEYIQLGKNNYLEDIQKEFFLNRGVKDAESLMNIGSECIRNPFDFTHMQQGIDLIKKCEDEGKDILTIEDSDVDGMTSNALLYKVLSELCFLDIRTVQHDKKVHGIFMDEIKDKLDNVGLVIVTDAGSNDFKEHELLSQMGIDVLIIDHHKCDMGYSPDATVINNQLDNISVNMCGVGMVYYFCKAFESTLGEDVVDNYLDLVAVGLIGDIMDSSDPEVQYLIQTGIENIKNEFINELLESTSFSRGGKQNQREFSFYIVPMMNAVIRMGNAEEKRLISEALCGINSDRSFTHEFKRGKRKGEIIEEDLYQHASRVATSLKGKQNRYRDKVLYGSKRPKKKGLMDVINQKYSQDKILVLDVTDYMENNGTTGLIASGLNGTLKKPVMLFLKKSNGNISGSARNGEIENFRKKLKDNKLISFAEGHEFAFGIRQNINKSENPEEKIKEIRENINYYFRNEDIRPVHRVDFNILPEHISDCIVEDLCQLEKYFGNGLKEPIIMLENIVVDSNNIRQTKTGNMFYFYYNDICFQCFDKNGVIFDKVVDWGDKMVYTLIGKPNVYTDNEKRVCQIIIEDIELIKILNNDNQDETNDDFGDEIIQTEIQNKDDWSDDINDSEDDEWEW